MKSAGPGQFNGFDKISDTTEIEDATDTRDTLFSVIVKSSGLFEALPETVAPLPAVHRLESPWVHAVVTVLLRGWKP